MYDSGYVCVRKVPVTVIGKVRFPVRKLSMPADVHLSLVALFQGTLPVCGDTCSELVSLTQCDRTRPGISLVPAEHASRTRKSILIPSESSFTTLQNMHLHPILCMVFTHRLPRRLVSASRDALVISTVSLKGLGVPLLLCQDIGNVSKVAVNMSDHWVACIAGCTVLAINATTKKKLVLEGHGQPVTDCQFCVVSANAPAECIDWLVTVSEDRTFKGTFPDIVWDLGTFSCIYQSGIVSQYAFCSVAVDPSRFCVSLATEDCKVRVYDMRSRSEMPCEPRLLNIIDTSAFQTTSDSDSQLDDHSAEKQPDDGDFVVVSSIPKWKQQPRPQTQSSAATLVVEHSNQITALAYTRSYTFTDASNASGNSAVGDYLFIGLNYGFYLLDESTTDMVFKYNFLQHPMKMECIIEDADVFDGHESGKNGNEATIQLVSDYKFSRVDGLDNCMAILASHSITGTLSLMRMYLKRDLGTSEKNKEIKVVDGSLMDTIKRIVECNVKGDKWVHNILSDCMQQLQQAGIRQMSDIQKFGSESIPESLPAYVRKELIAMICDPSDELALSKLSLYVSDEFQTNPKSLLATTTTSASPANQKEKEKNLEKSKASPTKKSVAPGRVGAKDMPVTFKPSVKSSGYSSAPAVTKLFTKPKLFKSPLKTAKTAAPLIAKSAIQSEAANLRYHLAISPVEFPGMLKHTSTVTCIRYNHSGTLLASSSVDKTVRFYRTPYSNKSACKDFSAHNGAISSVSWGCRDRKGYGTLLLSSCSDARVRIWSTNRTDPVLVFSTIKSSSSTATGNKQRRFVNEVKNASFYYRDRFVVIPHQDVIHVYTFTLEPIDSSSIKPQLNFNSYRLVKEFQGQGKSITAMACINSKLSSMLFSAASDKSMQVWDVNDGRVVRTIPEAHSRAVHCIALPDYTCTNTQLFATSAITDCIRLWDIRQNKSVMRLNGHVNRYASINACISQCGTFVTTGSEDHHGYIYDVRMGLVCGKTKRNHGDVVSSIEMNPTRTEIITGCGDGRLRRFSSL